MQAEFRERYNDSPGEGIGLWEALKYVQAHGGDIIAESHRTERPGSKKGVGFRTVFTIKLPIRQAIFERR